jgi:CRP-like cAMP-binding protein
LEVREEIISRANYVEIHRGQEIYHAEANIELIHFVEHGVVLFTKTMADGRGIMMSTDDGQGTTMPYAAVDGRTLDIACTVLIPGFTYVVPVKALRQIAARQPSLELLLHESIWRNREQVAQLSACNRLHSLKQRTARLLMTVHDCVGSKAFSLTQQELALMLGARRPHVAMVVAQFQKNGLIRYGHGEMQITEPMALKTASCECHGAISHIYSACGRSSDIGRGSHLAS